MRSNSLTVCPAFATTQQATQPNNNNNNNNNATIICNTTAPLLFQHHDSMGLIISNCYPLQIHIAHSLFLRKALVFFSLLMLKLFSK